jgi:hypothetical protein
MLLIIFMYNIHDSFGFFFFFFFELEFWDQTIIFLKKMY